MFGVQGRLLGAIAALAIALGGALWTSRTSPATAPIARIGVGACLPQAAQAAVHPAGERRG